VSLIWFTAIGLAVLLEGTALAAQGQVTIRFKSGAITTVPHLMDGLVGVPIGQGDYQYQLTPQAQFRPGKPFQMSPADIVLDARSSHFTITLSKMPYSKSRGWAEQFLMKKLRIGHTRLCDLNANVVSAPGTRYSNLDNLGFSGCYRSISIK
jgi:hypothetical protein